MQYDWSDAWLQQAAGWKAVKEGQSLHARGLVQNARFENDECRGTVQGGKIWRVRVKRLSATTAEAFCSCPENQRSGAICGHAVAVMIAARAGGMNEPTAVEHPKLIPPVTQTLVPALKVQFFPHWQEEWKKQRISVKIETTSREVEETDEVLWEWLQRQGVASKPQPWLLQLGPGKCEEFLACLLSHEDISSGKQTIACSAIPTEIIVNSQRMDGGLRVALRDQSGVFLGQKCSAWWTKNEQLFQIPGFVEAELLFQLFAEKYTVITYLQLFECDYLRRILCAEDATDPLRMWHLVTATPQWDMSIEGSLRQLRLRVDKCYQIGGEDFKRSLFHEGGFLAQQGNTCYASQSKDETGLADQLRQQGWSWDGAQWILGQEERILQFISQGRAELQAVSRAFYESGPWQEIQKRLIIVTPAVRMQATNSREISVDLQFSSNTGAALDAAKIRQLLVSGKRLIQTSDGKSLLLPKESWEVFQRTATDLHWAQQKGAFLAQKSHSLIVDYLRKYVDKSLNKNSLVDSVFIDFPVLKGELRDYQRHGAQWLAERLESHGFALLADDMGLGKTLQTIAVLTRLATVDRPALVVVPTSLLYNWEAEIQRFAPSLKTIVLHGADREPDHANHKASVVVTSYGVLMRDRALFMKREYSLMVLDEASAIRNPDTDVARCCYRMKAGAKLALTGTPLENSMEDLWSIFQFLQPGYLGERQVFRDTYERSGPADPVAIQSLRLRVLPFLLRRTKAEVVKDLPEKVESEEWCEMSPEQQKLYQSTWEQGAANLEKLTQSHDSSAPMALLTLLLRLRQICCDAGLFAPELLTEWSLEQRSGKMKRLFDLLNETKRSGAKMLVFSQFATQLRNIEAECLKRGIPALRLDGATRNRQELVDRFQTDPSITVFLISLKAGGYGLNLTAATSVVHFDPWWNPATEQQASDRAHRIGQKSSVNIYKLLTRGTVEERVKRLQASKSQMAAQMLGGSAVGTAPSMQEMAELLSLSRIPQSNSNL